MEDDDETTRYELKEKISFSYILLDRVLNINWSFDHEDKHRLDAGLWSLHDNLSPYLDEKQEKVITDSLEKLSKLRKERISDHESEFFIGAHETFRLLLFAMRDLKLLTKEVKIDTY